MLVKYQAIDLLQNMCVRHYHSTYLRLGTYFKLYLPTGWALIRGGGY